MTTNIEKKCILIVEDDNDIRFSIELILEEMGFVVRSTSNGEEALQNIKIFGMPNLILLDMIMPIMDGWQFTNRFRTQYDHQTPIVIMTAASNAKQRFEEVSVEGFISKPFSLDELENVINNYLK